MNWLIALSGADRDLLARVPGERAKYLGVGGAILMTAVMASLSATYAFYVAMQPPLLVALLLGLLWGAGILNLDRWIVNSTKRQGNIFKDITMFMPRLLLALIIGAVISEPIVLRIFNSEIQSELQVMQDEQKSAFATSWLQDPRYLTLLKQQAQVATLSTELAAGVPTDAVVANPQVKALTDQLATLDGRLAEADKAVSCEGVGTCGSGTAGAGPVFKANQERSSRLQGERSQLAAQLAAATSQAESQATTVATLTGPAKHAQLDQLERAVASTQEQRSQDVAAFTKRVTHGDGLLSRIEALDRLGRDHPSMADARKALFLFILAIECMPVLVKLFMNLAKPSAYELVQQAEEDAEHARVTLRLRTEAEEGHMMAQVALDAAEVRARAELDAHVAVARSVLDAQVTIGRAAAAKWGADKLVLLDDSPEQFYAEPSSSRATSAPPVKITSTTKWDAVVQDDYFPTQSGVSLAKPVPDRPVKG